MSTPLLTPPPQGSSAAAWQSFLDSDQGTSKKTLPSSKNSHGKQQQQQQQQNRARKLSTSAPSTQPSFPFLKLPIEVQVHALAFLSPDDLHACLTLNRETYQLITDPWPWKAAFLRLFHNLPLIALGSSWRTEYTKRTYTWRKLVGNVVNTYTGTRLSNVSHVLPTQGNLLTLCDKSFGVAIRLQLSNGRQTQVGRYAIHGGNGAADVNESHIALCKASRIQLLLFGNPSHNTQTYRQLDLATDESPLHVAWVSSLSRPLPSTLVVAYPGTNIEILLVHNNSNSSNSSQPPSATADFTLPDPVVRHSLPPLVNAPATMPHHQHHPHLPQPPVEQEQIMHVQASTSTIVALTSTSTKSTLFAIALPEANADTGDSATNVPRQLVLPTSEFGTITDVVYSASTHPLALLATSNLDSIPLVVVRIDGPGAPIIVARIPHTPSPPATKAAAAQSDHASQAAEADRVTAWAWTAGHSPASSFDPAPAPATASPTLILATGDTHGHIRLFALTPSPNGYTLTPTLTLSGHRFPITALHINPTLLISAATTGWVRIWDHVAGECVKRIQAYTRKHADRERVTHVCAWQGAGAGAGGARDRVAVVFKSGMVKVLEGRKAGGRRGGKGGASGQQGQGQAAGAGNQGGKGGANGALGRGASPTALHAEIQRELRDHRQSSHERQRLEVFAARLNGNVDLTEDEMVQLAMLLSSEPSAAAAGEWQHVPPEVLLGENTGQQPGNDEDWAAGLTEEEALRIALEQSLLEQ